MAHPHLAVRESANLERTAQAVITPHPLLVALVRHPVDQNCVRELIRHRLQLLPERTSQHLVGDGQRCCLTLREAPHRKRPTQHPLHLLDRSPHFTLGKQRGVLHHAHRGLLCWLLHHNQLTKEPHLSAQGFSRIHGRTSAYTPGRSSVSHPRPRGLLARVLATRREDEPVQRIVAVLAMTWR